MGRFRLAGAVVFVLLAAFPLAAQEKKQQEANFEVSVTAITIAATVQDRAGRFITDLTAKDFTILEDGEPRKITHFDASFDAPFSLTVLLDVSGSMAIEDKLRDCREAVRALIATAVRPQDEVSLLIFADGEVEVASPFSAGREGFLKALESAQAYGQTALNDAVAASPGLANLGKNERRAIILLTDGIENDSKASPREAIEIARKVDVPIYAIGYKIPMTEQYLLEYKRSKTLTAEGIVVDLSAFSEATGGRAAFLTSLPELHSTLGGIVRELSHQYILGYTTNRKPGDAFRKITVLASNKRYRVRTRQGY